jgi:hypothetical protein
MIDVTPWEFRWAGTALLPLDEALNKKATIFCRHFLAGHLDPKYFFRLWVAREGEWILGVSAIQRVWDVSVLHSIDERAADAMMMRVNSFLVDEGMRGNGILVSCPVKGWDAEPAERYTAVVR